MNGYLAVDIGASSGRHIFGWMENGKLFTEEVYRFKNEMKRENGKIAGERAMGSMLKYGSESAKEF